MTKRNTFIELMRFLFSILVVGYHLQMSMNNDEKNLFENGAVAVEFFFLISGYFMARSLEKMNQKNEDIPLATYQFMVGKVKGILPTHIVAIIGIILVTLILNFKGFLHKMWAGLPSIFLLQQAIFWKDKYKDALIIPEWYLSAMLLSMLFMIPVLLLLRRRFSGIKTTALTTGVFAVILVAVLAMMKFKFNTNFIYDFRAVIELLVGMFAYYFAEFLAKKETLPLSPKTLKIAEICCYGIPLLFGTLPMKVSLQPLCMAMTVIGVFFGISITFSGKGNQIKNDKANQVFGYLGAISLSVYLFHPVIIDALDYAKPDMTLGVKYGITLILTAVCSVAFKFLNDKRLQKAKEKAS